MGLLDGKRILVTGVLTDASLAFGVARLAQEEGAEIVLTGAGRGLSLTRRTARKLPSTPEVFELDVTDPAHVVAVREALAERWDRVDGALHAIGFAPRACSAATSSRRDGTTSPSPCTCRPTRSRRWPTWWSHSWATAARSSGSTSTPRVAWPAYDWMGVAKAALESAARYLARDLGPRSIRVNLVAAGPVKTMAAKSIPGFSRFEDVWSDRAPLGWEITNPEPVARACVALLSDWFPKTTGELVHVDGGFHAMGA